VEDTVLKSVESRCVADSVARNVTGDKLDCKYTQTFQYPPN